MSGLRFPQWRNENDQGKYPFAIYATLSNSTVLVPETLFADARLQPIGGNKDQYISKITKSDDEVVFYISDTESGVLATGTYQISTPSDRNAIALVDSYGRAAGVLVTDSTRMLPVLGWASGDYEFTVAQTPFVCGVVTPMPRDIGLRNLRVDDTSDDAVSGDVFIVGGRGIVLELAREGTDIVITVNAIGEPLYKQVICEGVGFLNPCKLRTINGVKPDPYGNFQIVPCCLETEQTLLRVDSIENGILIKTIGNT